MVQLSMCIVCVLIILIVIGYIVTNIYMLLLQKNRNRSPSILQNVDLSNIKSDSLIYMPLHYDENGVFVADIMVLGEVISVVIDTGSSHVLLGSYMCAQCRDSSRGYIKKLPSQQPIVAKDKIYYGSQQDSCMWFVEDVQFPSKAQDDNTMCVGQHTSHKKLPIALVVDRSGSSNYSILGIGYNFDTNYSRKEMQFMELFNRKIITFSTRDSTGELMIGGHNHPKPQLLFAMSPSEYFFGIQIYDIMIGNRSCREYHPETLPDRVIFDTGSNMMDFPQAFYTIFHKYIEQNLDDLHFIFRTMDGTLVRMTFDCNIYLWDSVNINSLIIEPAQDSLEKHVIWGSLFMNNLVFTFDIDNKTVGISRNK